MARVKMIVLLALLLAGTAARAQLQPVVPPEQRGRVDAERQGTHDASNIRTFFYNYGMVGDYPPDPLGVDLSVFHSAEVPKGSGLNYTDGITPFVLAKVRERNGREVYIMETGYRERQGISPFRNRVMRFEPRPGFFQADPAINKGRSPAVSNDPRTWPDFWPDKVNDPDDPGWRASWNGYFGKRPNADLESFTVMDDDFYDAWDFYPDSRDSTRRGLGLRIEVRGFQWNNPQAANVIFWHYDITNEGTTDYNENIIFGLYMDSGVGGSSLSCDGVAESDDDNAFYTKALGLNLVYTWDKLGHGDALGTNCYPTGYLGYSYLETPGKPFDRIDNDRDGIIDELRDGGPGQLLEGQDNIRAYFLANYNAADFTRAIGTLESRAAYRAARWFTGDEDMDWVAELHDTGADGVFGTFDTGEGDRMPTAGEPSFDRTDLQESDQIGLTGFKFNRIRPGSGNPNQEVENLVFFDDGKNWPKRLYDQFTDPDEAKRFDPPLALNYNIAFLFASGPFTLKAGKTERFSLALAYGADLQELENTVKTVQLIYNANYQFAVPPPLPTVTAESGDGYVRLSWDDLAERGVDPVSLENDFEGYRVYRSSDPEFRDPKVISTGRGTGPLGNGRPIAQFDLVNGKKGFSPQQVEGVSYYLGNDDGLSHTFLDTTVTNGQLYYYAVTAYDHGSDSLGFYPSENAITVSRTPRGGTILPKNVVAVRPNPRVHGYVPAAASNATQLAGRGTGSVRVEVVNSALVPDNHVFHLKFKGIAADSVRAAYYDLIDSTSGRVIFSNGYDLEGKGIGQVGLGLLPVVSTPRTVSVDSLRSGFTPTSSTNARLKVSYRTALPINLRRTGFPYDLKLTFSDVPIDTSLRGFGLLRARPAKFRVYAQTPAGELRMKFYFLDRDGDGKLSLPFPDEFIDVVTYLPNDSRAYETWRVALDTTGQAQRGPLRLPAPGDVYEARLIYPFEEGELFRFQTTGEFISPQKARAEATQAPYVVPNPYVGMASFEAERFAISGRGERRLEFRNLPQNCTIRIYTVRGELVQTLYHDASTTGMVPWNLRSKDNLDVAPGLYLFHVEAPGMATHIGKFAIIK
ncbi:MAG: hypothetical protein ONB48_16015 [candidate division KSB1 bacterium]|nr:hypothetical protein [candidate division KSB1 bacterium]MDZ7274324.1 hypothetical protein [candidate division KSB1 bacterium]MDZ7287154.1 hypothetical protein [candidate division KSB1 bacterium]MDZ7296921.1 hypothetical protein [candidate division KSB1 bacterium]MDZ7307874.1 hypothetical protein [candidate division KSB1 bacterium]